MTRRSNRFRLNRRLPWSGTAEAEEFDPRTCEGLLFQIYAAPFSQVLVDTNPQSRTLFVLCTNTPELH